MSRVRQGLRAASSSCARALALPLLPLAALTAGCGGGSPPQVETAPTHPGPTEPTTSAAASTAPVSLAPSAAERADAAPRTPDASAEDVRASNGFAFALYGKARKTPGNAMVSGTSLRHALAAVALGARGQTGAEMTRALALPEGADAIARNIGEEARAFAASVPEGGALKLPTRVWVDDAFTLAPDYVARTKQLGASAESLALGEKPEPARAAINAWVANETAGRIPEVVGKGAIDRDTKVVVTNAVYMKARWVEPFPKNATADAPFKVSGKKEAQVPTMRLTAGLGHAAVSGAQVVELRYDGSPLAMLIAVPDEPTGLAKLEESLAAETLERWTKELTMKRVALALPRFTFASGGSLKKPLEALGVSRMFTNAAELDGVGTGGTGHLRVSDVVQRTFIAVDELGTEAAAATGVTMRTTSLMMGQPLEVKVDRPFLFVIRDTAKGRVLFTGRVDDPRSPR